MREMYEVWRYSITWKKWIRDVYFDMSKAEKRYDLLKKNGKRVKMPQPINKGIRFYEKLNSTERILWIIGGSVIFVLSLVTLVV